MAKARKSTVFLMLAFVMALPPAQADQYVSLEPLSIRHSATDWNHGYCLFRFEIAGDAFTLFESVTITMALLADGKQKEVKELSVGDVGGGIADDVVEASLELPCGAEGEPSIGDAIDEFSVLSASGYINGQEVDLIKAELLRLSDYVFKPLPIKIEH